MTTAWSHPPPPTSGPLALDTDDYSLGEGGGGSGKRPGRGGRKNHYPSGNNTNRQLIIASFATCKSVNLPTLDCSWYWKLEGEKVVLTPVSDLTADAGAVL